MSSCGDAVPIPKYVRSVLKKLLTERRRYFDKRELLNSDGRKLLEEALRKLVRYDPGRKRLVRRIRREPSYSELLRLVQHLLGDECAEELAGTGFEPYTYRTPSSPYEIRGARGSYES